MGGCCQQMTKEMLPNLDTACNGGIWAEEGGEPDICCAPEYHLRVQDCYNRLTTCIKGNDPGMFQEWLY